VLADQQEAPHTHTNVQPTRRLSALIITIIMSEVREQNKTNPQTSVSWTPGGISENKLESKNAIP